MIQIFPSFSWDICSADNSGIFLIFPDSEYKTKSEFTPRADILVGITVSSQSNILLIRVIAVASFYNKRIDIQILRFQGPWRAPDHLK